MDAQQKERVALFRYGVISELVGTTRLEYGEAQQLINTLRQRQWEIPYSQKTSISASTIRRWIRLYEQAGGDYKALLPEERADRGRPRVIDEETILSLIKLRKENPNMSVKRLVKHMKMLDLVTPGYTLTYSTAYRILKQEGLTKRKLIDKTDRRRYEAQYPNEIWQSDVMHAIPVEVDGKQRKTYLIAFLDDHSRLIPHGEFYTTERMEPFLDAFRKAMLKRGVPRKLYVDNGAVYRSTHLHKVCASLGISKYHAPPYTPQGKGKIERFFRTVRDQFINGFKGKTLDELNETFELWLSEEYHQRKHSSTQETPYNRFSRHVEMLRKAPRDMEEHFRKEARRRVTKDRTVSLDRHLFEAPATLIGEYVILMYHEHKPFKVEIFFNGKSHGYLVPLDKHINCSASREIAAEPKPISGTLPF